MRTLPSSQSCVWKSKLPAENRKANIVLEFYKKVYIGTSALIVLLHNDRGVIALIVKEEMGVIE